MACYKPLHGYVSKVINPNGKRSTVFRVQDALFIGNGPQRRQMPCGQCIGCRLEYSRQWAIRIMHEASLHDSNCFLTLTYDHEHLPDNGFLVKKDFQDFMKRLRKNTGLKIRFYHCGEYGENFGRPHYHACVFGADFRDGEIISRNMLQGKEILLYDSPAIQKIWKKGFVSVGELTFESAAYVARYVTKKVNGKRKDEHYEFFSETTGEYCGQRPQEYCTMSRRPGIGAQWFEAYTRDVYPKDFTTVRGTKCKPPKFYDRLLECKHKELFEKVKAKRFRATEKLKGNEDFTDHRLAVRERVHILQAKLLNRRMENDSEVV